MNLTNPKKTTEHKYRLLLASKSLSTFFEILPDTLDNVIKVPDASDWVLTYQGGGVSKVLLSFDSRHHEDIHMSDYILFKE